MGNQTSSAISESTETESEIETIKNELVTLPFYKLIDQLQSSLSTHSIILPQDKAQYVFARHRVFNCDHRGFPYLIVQPRNAEDVSKAIKFYRQHVLPSNPNISLCVSCGGHSSKCMITRSFVVDVRYINKVTVNYDHNLVTVGGGTYIKEIDRALAQFNLAVPVGTYPVVGIGGLALGGGYGWLSRRYGLTVDYIKQLEIVTADGDIIIANEVNEHKDLLWAYRGGGGNFGVVTQFTFRCVKLPSRCYGGFLTFYPTTLDAALSTLKAYDELVQHMGYETSSSITLRGGSTALPTAWVHCGEEVTLDEVKSFKEARNVGGWLSLTVENSLRERSFHNDVQCMLVPFHTSGHIYVTILPIGSSDEPLPSYILENLINYTREPINSYLRKTSVVLMTIGGAAELADVDNTLTCIPDIARKARYLAIIESRWKSEYGFHGKVLAKAWAKGVVEILAPCKTVGVKYAGDEIIKDANSESEFGFSSHVYKRLQEIKMKYDNKNIFRNNLNISPLSGESNELEPAAIAD